jgi:tetratricopeptide (TPR) repeat protein
MWLRRFPEAERLLDRAIAVGPDRTDGYVFKHWLHYNWHGPSPQSRRVLEEAPKGSLGLEASWFLQEYGERNYEAALEWLARHPERVITAQFTFRPKSLDECRCHLQMSEPERAREACEAARLFLEEAVAVRPEDPEVHAALGRTYALLGLGQEAIREGERAVALLPVSKDAVWGPLFVRQLTTIYAEVGEPDAALDRVEYLLSIPTDLTLARLRLEPDWDPLRDHPRFQELLEQHRDQP